jgi:hypothetical protein
MAIKQVWIASRRKWKEIDTRANRKTLLWIKRNALDRKINVSDIERAFAVTRDCSVKRLARLHQNGFLRTKRLTARKFKDNREFWLSARGKTSMPRKKEKEVEIREVIKEVPVKIPIENKLSDKVFPVKRI